MKRILRRIKNNKGFTLVELLIVFALLAVLAAIVIPNVTGFADYGQTQAAEAELSIVQTAMDSMMAQNGLSAVTLTTATDNMSAFPTNNVLYPTYLRFELTKGEYSCTTTGLVTQDDDGY